MLVTINKMLRNNHMKKPIINSTILKTLFSILPKFSDETLESDIAMLIANRVGDNIVHLEREKARSFATVILSAICRFHTQEKLVAACLPVLRQYAFTFDVSLDRETFTDCLETILPSVINMPICLEQTFDILSAALRGKSDQTERLVSVVDKAISMLHKTGNTNARCHCAVIRLLCRTEMSADDIVSKVLDQRLQGIGLLCKELYDDSKEMLRHVSILMAMSRNDKIRLECRRNYEAIEMVILGMEYSLTPDSGENIERLLQMLQVLNKIK